MSNFVDLRKYGQKVIIETTGAIIDFEKANENVLRVACLKGGFEIKFLSKEQMDEFTSFFTGTFKNI